MSPSPVLIALALAQASNLDLGAQALAEFRTDDAIALFEKARDEGPWRHADHVRLYEQLGIAYAYRERTADALAAFEKLIALDPGHAIPYTLSPKATFVFENARRAAAEHPSPQIDVFWRRDLAVSDAVPIDVEVIADPQGFLRTATLYWRVRGASTWNADPFALLPAGRAARRVVPALLPAPARPETIEVHLVGFDAKGNEVLLWGSSLRPREIPLAYRPPPPWYARWPVLAAAGAAVAVAGGVVVFAVARPPSPTLDIKVKPLP